MQKVSVAIVGAGLAGLYAAYVLEKKGIKDYVVLEARDVLGGRIASTQYLIHILRCRRATTC